MMEFDDGLIVHPWYGMVPAVQAKHKIFSISTEDALHSSHMGVYLLWYG